VVLEIVCLFACAPPSPPVIFLLEDKVDKNKKIDGKEGGMDDADDAANDTDAAANNAALADDNYATMPPKVKPIPRKTATKRESADVVEMPLPAPSIIANFSIDSND
jgi:hypothetical protein